MAPPGFSSAANEIELLAGRCQRSLQLRELARGLREFAKTPPEPESARQWAAVDLFAAFLTEEPAVPESGRSARIWAIADTAVQMLVFVPILLTWVGLTWAGIAYASDKSGESFLQGWQTGFHGGMPGWFTFDQVALYTACMVFLLISGTVALIIHRKAVEEKQAELRQDLAAAFTRADLELAPLRLGIAERVAIELRTAADKLEETVGAIEAVGREARLTQQQATLAVAAVPPALTSVQAAATASRDAATELGSAPDRFSGHLDRLVTATGDVAKAERELIDAVGDSSGKLAKAVSDSSATVANSANASSMKLADSVVESSKKLVDTLGAEASEIRTTLAEVPAAMAGYAHRTEVAADILGHAKEAINGLPKAVADLRADVSGIGSQIADLTAAITAAKDATVSLLAAVTALRQSPFNPSVPANDPQQTDSQVSGGEDHQSPRWYPEFRH